MPSAASPSGGPWAAGAGPGDAPLTIDLDSTICETYGLQKEGALHHGYSGVRGYHPLLAIAAGTGDVLMARLREGRAHIVADVRPPDRRFQRRLAAPAEAAHDFAVLGIDPKKWKRAMQEFK